MKIIILTYLESETDKAVDAVVDPVAEALRAGGHEVAVLGVHGDLKKLLGGLTRHKPDLVFNIMEMFGDSVFGDVAVTGLLELLGLPFTGGGPGELYLAQDKGLGKKLLAFDGIKYPRYLILSRDDGALEVGGNLSFPIFVKPLRSDASIGIDDHALVHNFGELVKRVAVIHGKCHDSALAEEYIEGREFYVGILGNGEPQAFPPIEMDFSGLPEGAPRIMGQRAKFDKRSKEYRGTKAVVADLPDELRARLQRAALDAYRALRVRDYGRVDLRLSQTNEIYVIEVNASCYLEPRGEFATAAAAAGLDYGALINRIAELALLRHRQGR